MKKSKSLAIVDKTPMCEDVVLSLSWEGYIDINDSDSFTLTVERADAIIAWLTEWKKQEVK